MNDIIEDLYMQCDTPLTLEEFRAVVKRYVDECCQVSKAMNATIEIYDADGNEVDPKRCMIQRNSIMRVADGEEVEHDTDLYIIRLPFATESHLWTQAWREKRENYKGR